MVVAGVGPAEEAHIDRYIQVLHIEDVRARVVVAALLIALIVHEQETVVLGEPALVAKASYLIDRRSGDQGDVRLVGHIGDGHPVIGVDVEIEADPFANMLGIRPLIIEHGVLVDVAFAGESACQGGGQRVAHVHHDEPTAEHVRTYRVYIRFRLVREDGMAVAEARVVGILREGGWWSGHGAQSGKVEHLHTVSCSFAAYVAPVAMCVHVAPK